MSDDRRCRACRRWTPSDPADRAGWGECRLTAADADGEPRDPESLAVALGGPGKPAVLTTAGAFGCVQWAPLPRDQAPPAERP